MWTPLQIRVLEPAIAAVANYEVGQFGGATRSSRLDDNIACGQTQGSIQLDGHCDQMVGIILAHKFVAFG